MFPVVIETDRLRLERVSGERLDPFEMYEHAREGAPTVDEETEYLSWDPHATPGETFEFVERAEERWADREAAVYAVRPREPEDGAGEFAGTTELSVDWERRLGTLGVWLRKPFWGRGYSGERAAALLALAFERLDLELVAVEHLVGNENSRRAIEKYVEAHGGRHEGRLRNWHAGGDRPRDAHRYSVTRAEYHEADGHGTEVGFVDG